MQYAFTHRYMSQYELTPKYSYMCSIPRVLSNSCQKKGFIGAHIWQASLRAGNDPYWIGVFCLAVKPINLWINLLTYCNVFCVSINTTWRSSSFKFTSFTCWTWIKQPLNWASKFYFYFYFVCLLVLFQLTWNYGKVF